MTFREIIEFEPSDYVSFHVASLMQDACRLWHAFVDAAITACFSRANAAKAPFGLSGRHGSGCQ
jgi:hypothetical protein